MSRPARQTLTSTRERLKQDFSRAATLRQIYPQLAEVRVEFEFQDGAASTPSPQSFAYFPAARGFFRYACPCHSCSGEFDLSGHVAELVHKAGRAQRSRRISIACTGLRPDDTSTQKSCPICAQVRLCATLHNGEAHRDP